MNKKRVLNNSGGAVSALLMYGPLFENKMYPLCISPYLRRNIRMGYLLNFSNSINTLSTCLFKHKK